MEVIITINLLNPIKNFLVENPRIPIIAVVILFFIFLLIIFANKSGSEKKLKNKLFIIDELESIEVEKDYEKQLSRVLNLVKKYSGGDGYYIYLYDELNSRYRLERVLFDDETNMEQPNNKIQVGYGRIMTYTKETYSPPLYFENATIPEQISMVMEGRFSLLIVPVSKQIGFIGISTKRRKTPSGVENLKYLSEKLSPLFENFVAKSNKHIGYNAEDYPKIPDSALSKAMDIILKIFGGYAGLFFTVDNNYCELTTSSGYSNQELDIIKSQLERCMEMIMLLSPNEWFFINRGDNSAEVIPDFIQNENEEFTLFRNEYGMLLISHTRKIDKDFYISYRKNIVLLILEKFNCNRLKNRDNKSAVYYLEELRSIVSDIDNQEPYSIGLSDLMARYAIIVARQMNLSSDLVNKIETAALLSNIGVVAIPEKILRKKGIYSEKEYDIVRSHVEIGTFIVDFLLGNSEVTEIIRHHHENIDGSGYPDGLEKEKIPLGSRIISVVQSFLSKIKGRNYRDPLPFERIVDFIREESADSLDGEIVEILINWFRNKQEDPKFLGRPLGSCWEMRCSSKEICSKCPAYKRKDKFCWEFEYNNCRAHGNVCETCYVYTEYKDRNKPPIKEKRKLTEEL